jgi:SpoVK/Ycf46/Vps4 family AAA+-type ATPase
MTSMTRSAKSEAEIEHLIRARYPLIYVVSWEEARVEDALQAVALRRGKKLIVWSVTEGMVGVKGGAPAELRDPLKALEWIMESKEDALFVMRDFHPFLTDPTVVRRLRDLGRHLKKTYKNIVVVAPLLKVPPELEKEINVVYFEMPSLEDLDQILDKVIRSVPKESETWAVIDKLSAAEREAVLEAALGLTADEAENAYSKCLVKTKRFDIDVILAEKEQIIRKSRVLEFHRTSEQFSDIGGLDQLKEWLRKRQAAFTRQARDFGLPESKGILLIGVPGCGKSLTAKAVSSLWKLPLLRLDVGRIFEGLVGSSEENARQAIRMAEAIAPSILWIDELEKGFSGTQSSSFSDAGTTARVFGTFVTWLQEKSSPVFVISTANNISMLPPELLRKGRFDEIFFVDLPKKKEREEIFAIHIKKRKRDPAQFDLEKLAAAAEGFSGSEIEQAIISALFDAFDERRDLTTDGILASLAETMTLSQTMEEEINTLREWAVSRARLASTPLSKEREAEIRRIEV